MSIDSVYNAKILDHAGNIERIGRLDNPDATAKAHSKLCGSTVVVDIQQENGVVTDYAQDVKACALGQASSAILAKNVIGASFEELSTARQQMLAMLKENGPPPTGKFEELKFLEPVRDYRARHASTMLAFDAVVSAMQQALDKQSEVA
ncbi:MAG: iron-sulfur cluster assembly scaffold protein [Rhizobiaceae bacterium]|nr:iron-sulfur cluster assembly scaffold protein [Hyphomicrobiales bacterium]NRB31221.1 iron-sulfur cluster assembly scaffold protein [Rhizobiaceae bacterium]